MNDHWRKALAACTVLLILAGPVFAVHHHDCDDADGNDPDCVACVLAVMAIGMPVPVTTVPSVPVIFHGRPPDSAPLILLPTPPKRLSTRAPPDFLA